MSVPHYSARSEFNKPQPAQVLKPVSFTTSAYVAIQTEAPLNTLNCYLQKDSHGI